MLLDSTTCVSGTAIDEHNWQGIGDGIGAGSPFACSYAFLIAHSSAFTSG